MKNLAKILCVPVLLFLVFSGCSDDESPANQITVNGITFKFEKAYMQSIANVEAGEDLGSVHLLLLAGEGIELDEDYDITGEGDVVFMTIASADPEKLNSGKYDMPYFTDGLELGTILNFQVYEDYSIEFDGETDNEEYTEVFEALTGTINVSKSGSKHTFKINLDNYFIGEGEGEELGRGNIKGYFNGKLQVVVVDEGPGRIGSPDGNWKWKRN